MRSCLAIFLMLLLAIAGQELTEEQRIASDAARERTLNEVAKAFPGINVPEMLDFYEQNASDMLNEWRIRCIYAMNTAQEYLNALAQRYLLIEDMRKKSPEFYQYNVEQLRMEMEIRKLSYAIKAMSAQDGKKDEVQDLKAKLETLLKTSFDKAQEMEEKKLRKMEAQLEELRSQIQKRAVNRDIIIQQKFKLLTDGNQ